MQLFGFMFYGLLPCEISESLEHFQVADELVAEFADPGNSAATPDQVCGFLRKILQMARTI